MSKKIDGYTLVDLENVLHIEQLVTVHYFEYSKNYIFEGEKHDFWEFLYIDKGEISLMADDRKYILKQGEMIFHKPGEWHNVIANGKVAPNLIVVSFVCNSDAMTVFDNKVITLDKRFKHYLGDILREAKNVFSSSLADPMLKDYKKRKKIKFGSEQLLKLYLKMFLIELIRDESNLQPVTRTSPHIREYVSEEKVNIVINMLNENIHESLSLNDICKKTLLSKSTLQKLFKESVNMSVMEYFKRLKIKEAKILIRENNHNFTEISELLGYNSIHYFSRIFKNETGMTLSEYAKSVKGMIE